MTGNEAVAQVQQYLGWRSDKAAEILVALQQIQDSEEQGVSLPWFLLSEDQTLTTVADQNYIALPSGFIRETETEGPHYLSSANVPTFLSKGDYGRLYQLYAASDPGAPKAYAIRESRIYFFPTPDAVYTLYWDFWAHDDAITGVGENAWLANFPDLLIGGATRRLAGPIRDRSAMDIGAELYNINKGKLLAEMIEREASSRTYVMGGAT